MTENLPEPASPPPSPTWSPTVKVIVVVVAMLIMVVVAWRFQSLIGQLVVAAIVAYLLHPLITMLDERTPLLKRSSVVVILYLFVFTLIILGIGALSLAAYDQATTLIRVAPTYVADFLALLETWVAEPRQLGPFSIDLSALLTTFDANTVREQVVGLIEPAFRQGGSLLARLASSTLSVLVMSLFVLVVSIYLAVEIPRVGEYIGSMATFPGYRADAERLMREFGRIWSRYLRGQIVLGLVMGLTVGIVLSILGVNNAVALGILSGLMEFVPIIGALIGTATAVLVAFFQPDNYLALTQFQYAGVVLLVMFILQQIENNVLVPRIVGDALDLHPLAVMVAVFMGGALAGILGAVLAAPVAATIKLVGVYAWHKLFDQDPFAEPESEDSPPLLRSFVDRARGLVAAVASRGSSVRGSEDEAPAPEKPGAAPDAGE